jgi:aspartokinase
MVRARPQQYSLVVILPSSPSSAIEIRSRRHCCYVRIIEGDLSSPARERCESSLFARLSEDGVAVMMVAVHDGYCAFAVDGHDITRLQDGIRGMNCAVRIQDRCTRVTLTYGDPGRLPHVAKIIAALAAEGIGIVHLAADRDAVSILVHDHDGARAAAVLERCALQTSRAA